jgi:hypothetical protein
MSHIEKIGLVSLVHRAIMNAILVQLRTHDVDIG